MQFQTLAIIVALILIFDNVWSQTILQNIVHKFVNSTRNSTDGTEMARRKKSKYVYLLLGALIFKSVIIPLVLKTIAVISGVAVILSTMSLIISSILGYARLAIRNATPAVKILAKFPHSWAKDDENVPNNIFLEPLIYDQKGTTSGDHYIVASHN